MNNENNGTPILEETYYDPTKTAKKGGPTGVSEIKLDDDTYVAKTEKKGDLSGVSKITLDDDTYVAPVKKAEPIAPVITVDDSVLMNFTPEQQAAFDRLTPEQQREVIEMRRQQYLAQFAAPVAAPVLDDDNYVPPVKETKPAEPVQPVVTPILDDEPELPVYESAYVNEDLERVKKEAGKRAVESQLTASQKDEKESLRMMNELRKERELEEAKKGFKIVIIVMIIGIIASVMFGMFASTDYKEFSKGITKDDLNYSEDKDPANETSDDEEKPEVKDNTPGKVFTVISDMAFYFSVFAGIGALLLITGLEGLKGLTSFIYLVFTVFIIITLIAVLPQKVDVSKNAVYCVGALVGSFYVLWTLSASDAVGLYYSTRNQKVHERDL